LRTFEPGPGILEGYSNHSTAHSAASLQ
jgi:hypothetical protein